MAWHARGQEIILLGRRSDPQSQGRLFGDAESEMSNGRAAYGSQTVACPREHAGYDGIDGIAEAEVGRWPGLRNRFEPPIGPVRLPDGGARLMLQAAKRAGATA